MCVCEREREERERERGEVVFVVLCSGVSE